MPFQVGSIALHDDGQHLGSAKRDVADGLAGLGPGGELLAPGPDLELTRDGSDNIEVVERTSSDIVYRWTRVGVNDYECRINCGGVACKMLNDSLINAANGLAGLDAAGLLGQALFPEIESIYKISDDLLHSHDAEGNTGAGAYAKVKTIALNSLYPDPSTLRIKFDLKISTPGGTAYGKLYKNGGAVGTERINGTTNYVTYSEDIQYAEGDTLELYIYKTVAGNAFFRNFQVFGIESEITLKEAIESGDCGIVDAFAGTNTTP